jgi:hypothetical protein
MIGLTGISASILTEARDCAATEVALVNIVQHLRHRDLQSLCDGRQTAKRRIRLTAIDDSGNHFSALEPGRINITVNTARQITHVLEISLAGLLEPRVIERDRQLVPGRSMRSAVYTGKMSSCRFSSRPILPRTAKIVGRLAKGFPAGVAFGGGGGSRMGAQPCMFTVNRPRGAVRFTTGKSVQFPT